MQQLRIDFSIQEENNAKNLRRQMTDFGHLIYFSKLKLTSKFKGNVHLPKEICKWSIEQVYDRKFQSYHKARYYVCSLYVFYTHKIVASQS